MIPWTLDEVAALTNGRLLRGNGKERVTGVSHDTRSLNKGDLYVAIVGRRLDGHRFLKEAARKGAKAALVSRFVPGNGLPQIRVADTTRALGELGRSQRLQWDGPVVAVTGSVGKTTVKDMTAHLLSGKMRTLRSEGNLNNHWGLPLTLLRLTSGHQAAVVELGINHPGEMEWLSEVARPDVAVVTAIGEAHLGFFEGKRQLAKEKLRIGTALREGGKMVLNADDTYLAGAGKNAVTFGLKLGQVRAKKVQADGLGSQFLLAAQGQEIPTRLSVPGRHNVTNALAAVSAGLALGLPLKYMAQRLKSFRSLSPMRMEIQNVRGILFLNDAYNASPTSMEAALSTFKDLKGPKRKIAVLGDMLELGDHTQESHERIVRKALELKCHTLLLVGKAMGAAAKDTQDRSMEKIQLFDQAQDARTFLKGIARKGDAVLLKGSRGMRLEKILEDF
jgi:UDP-N-acetylmuramoyl-tripeptide--D-alanyl-D-alanine ligase